MSDSSVACCLTEYRAYTSFDRLTVAQRVNPGFSTPAGLGQTLRVDQPGGIGSVVGSGGGFTWGVAVGATENLVPVLIQPTS